MPWQVGGYATEGEKPFDQGSFGTVWRARRLSDDAPVALKLVLLTDAADSPERIAAERHGAMLQQRFQQAHGMVPTVYDFGHDPEGHLYIAMELIEGGAIADLIKAGPVAAELAASHAVRICEFLERAHRFATTVEGEPYDRLVHADLKPGHLLVGAAGDVKVLDFGIAKALAKTTQVTTNNWGTSAYASPERLEHGHVNEHVDFWSLGVILYEMLAGHRPYPALDRNRSQLEQAIRNNLPRAPLPESTPAALAAIVNKLLAYQVERRYPSAAAIREDLQLFLDGRMPRAAREYATPETVPLGLPRPAAAAPTTPTAARVSPPVDIVPPTDPLPAAAAPPALAGSAPAPAQARQRRAPAGASRRIGRGAARHGRGRWPPRASASSRPSASGTPLTHSTAGSLAETRAEYDAIRSWSVLGLGLHAASTAPCGRGSSPSPTRSSPTTAARSRRWRRPSGSRRSRRCAGSRNLGGPDRRLQAKLLTCDAHVIRLSARGPARRGARDYRRAVEGSAPRRTSTRVLRSLPRHQPDRGVRARRRRSGGHRDPGGREARLRFGPPRARAPRRRLSAARDAAGSRPGRCPATSAGASSKRRAPTTRAASTPSIRSSGSARRRRTSKCARASSNASTKSSPPTASKVEGL